jgi:hypothetical protein
MLQPISPEPAAGLPSDERKGRPPFAIFEHGLLVALSRAMPDAQSAILFCLAWQASLQKKMLRGPLAGQALAKLSGPQLAEITSRPIRTVRHALSRLRKAMVISNEQSGAGKKGVYRLSFVPPAEGEDRPSSQ